MKKNKKLFTKLFLMSFIVTSTLSSFHTYTYANSDFQNVQNIEDETPIESYKNVVEALENKEYASIKKVDINESSSSVSNILSENIDKNNSKTGASDTQSRFNDGPSDGVRKKGLNLADGTYVIDRKEGWVLGNDKGFLQSIIIPAGATGTIEVTKGVKTSNSFSIVSTAEFSFEFVSTAVKVGYGYSIVNSSSISVNQSIKAPEDKNLFVKAQTVYRRFDTVNIKNNKVVDLASTYVPVSPKLTKLEFETGAKVNQSRLFEKTTRNIFGDQEIDNKHLTDKNVSYEKTNVVNRRFKYETELLEGASNASGIYFDVLESGEYTIGNSFGLLNEEWYDLIAHFGTGTGMTLYKVSNKNEQIVEQVIAKVGPTTLKEDIQTTTELERNLVKLTANLKKGEKYLLVINEDRVKSKHHKNKSKYFYTVYFNKK